MKPDIFTRGIFSIIFCLKKNLNLPLFPLTCPGIIQLNNNPFLFGGPTSNSFSRVFDVPNESHMELFPPFRDGMFQSRYDNLVLPSDYAFVIDSAPQNVSSFVTFFVQKLEFFLEHAKKNSNF